MRVLVVIKNIIGKLDQEIGYSNYKIGAMMELPRAIFMAEDIAREVDYISFGTNDLTQTTYGISRDDSKTIISKYIEQGIYQNDPFEILDIKAVGELMKIAVKSAKLANPQIKIGACGENLIDAKSMKFCYNIGIDYVSCSAYKIPKAKLLSAHLRIKE